MFDTVGTLIAVAKQGGLLDKQGRLPRAREALLADAIGTVGGSIFGTPTVTSYVESAAGVAAGGRTGLVGLVVSACFFLSLFFTPIVSAIGGAGAVTAPALIIVGSMMIKAALDVKWDDYSEAIPAFLAMATMPLTYSIANGISWLSSATLDQALLRVKAVRCIRCYTSWPCFSSCALLIWPDIGLHRA